MFQIDIYIIDIFIIDVWMICYIIFGRFLVDIDIDLDVIRCTCRPIWSGLNNLGLGNWIKVRFFGGGTQHVDLKRMLLQLKVKFTKSDGSALPWTSAGNIPFLVTYGACLRVGGIVLSYNPSHCLQFSQIKPIVENG